MSLGFQKYQIKPSFQEEYKMNPFKNLIFVSLKIIDRQSYGI